MNGSSRLLTFAFVTAIVYVLAYDFGWQLFAYYPLVKEFHTTPQPKTSGPAMMYYGWMATAAIAGIVAALVVPPKLAPRFWPSLAWAVPLALTLFTLFYEKHWFV